MFKELFYTSRNKGNCFAHTAFVVFLLIFETTFAQDNIDMQAIASNLFGSKPVQTRAGEFLLDSHIISGADTSDQWSSAIAFDGTNYLVVWVEQRTYNHTDIYGARVTSTGVLIDTSEIAISTAPNNQWAPAVAFNGSNYLVVWQDFSSDPLDANIVGTRVSPDGLVLDPTGLVISDAPNRQAIPVVISNGSQFLVVWQDLRSGSYDIYGARVTTGGLVLDTAGIIVTEALYGQTNPAVAFDGANYTVVWQGFDVYYKIFAARVNQSGIVLDTSGILIASGYDNAYLPDIAFDGSNYLVAWQGGEYGEYIACIRIDQTAHAIDSSAIFIAGGWFAGCRYPKVAFDGSKYLVVWQNYSKYWFSTPFIAGARVNPSGVILDTVFEVSSAGEAAEESPAITTDGAGFLVAWDDYRNGYDSDIYGARINLSGAVVSNFGISTVPDYQWSPSVSFDGTNYFAVWDDDKNGTPDIFGTRISPTGVILDPLPIAISTTPDYQITPDIAFDGTNYLVVWADYRSDSSDIFGARVDPAGNVLDPDGFPIAVAQCHKGAPSVAFGTSNYLVVWQQSNYSSYWDMTTFDIQGALISQNGIVLDTVGISLIPNVTHERHPAVAFDGANFLVVWEDDRIHDWWEGGIYGARVNQNAILIDTNGIAISSFFTDVAYSPTVVFDGDKYFVVCEQYYGVYATRVSQSGVVIDTAGIWISGNSYGTGFPAVEFDGTNYFTAWGAHDIYGSTVSTQGTLIDTFIISNLAYDQHCPAVAHGSGNQMLIVYSGWCDSIDGIPANTMRTWGKFYPFTGVDQNYNELPNIRSRIRLYPNPFADVINIECEIPVSNLIQHGVEKNGQKIQLKIYNSLGRLVKFFNLEPDKSKCHLIWQGDDYSGRRVPAGVYFCCLKTGNVTIAKKILLVR